MNIAIIEDESLAADRLREMILDIQPDTHIMAVLGSIEESVEWLKNNTPDLIFLDIQLSDGNSFDIFEQIEVKAPIIFTTAHDQYAIKAFKLKSIDYLLKPIRREELDASLTKFNAMQHAFQQDIAGLLESIQSQQKQYKQRFLLQYGETLKKVEVSDIAYFYAQDKCVFLVTVKGDTLPMDYSLAQLEDMLDPDQFFRINRQMLISYDSIKQMHAYSRSRIKIDLTPPAPKGLRALVSIERTPIFKDWIDK